ncbi:MAG: biotin/lipoyl-containing protein [Rikenellaceae bacterium]
MKEYNLKINGNDYVVGIDINDETSAEVVVNGAAYHVELQNSTVKKSVARKPQVVATPASHPVSNTPTPAASPRATVTVTGSEKPVTSPLPGVILDLKVAVGDTVSSGQTLVVLEAMKMENNIDSNFSGVVKSIKVKCGDSVLEGDVLITIE